jgi:hypothetical protein
MPLLDVALTAVCAGEVQDLFVIEGVFRGMFRACNPEIGERLFISGKETRRQ